MSDEEYDYQYDSDAENYKYDSDAEVEEAGDEGVEIENAFYEGDDLKNEDPRKAISFFQKAVDLETACGDEVKWRFKALQRLVSIYDRLGEGNQMVNKYKEMLSFMPSVTRNDCTEAINTILDNISKTTNVEVLSQMYEITLDSLKSSNNDRLLFDTNKKLAKLYLDSSKLTEVERLLKILKQFCQSPDGSDDTSKGTYLLEVYCIEIQLCALTGNSARMRKIYPHTLNVNAAVSDPRIMGIIREEGGKMYMSDMNWTLANNEFYEAFRAFQEAGNTRAKDCLKYVVLASMLGLSDINPFAAREAKVYAEDPEILAMSELRQSLEANDLARFERTLTNPRNRIQNEPYLMSFIHPLRMRMREQVLLNLTRPYQKVTLEFLGKELTLSILEVERLLVDMILDQKMSARIDQINGYLILGGGSSSVEGKKMQAITKWANSIATISDNLASKGGGN